MRDRGAGLLDHLRQSLPGTHPWAVDQVGELALIVGEPGAIRLRMPQMQHAGREAAVLAQHAGADHADEDVGVLAAPTAERRIEAVDLVEIGAPERHVAAARATPAARAEIAQIAERQAEQRLQPVDPAPGALGDPAGKAPLLGLEAVVQDALRQFARQQNPIAGDEPAGLGEPAMGGDEVGPRDAVAVEEDAVAAGARPDRAVADLGEAKAAVAVPEPSSATRSSKPRSVWRDSERSTAASASSRL